jgi:hypothetical protein
MSAYHLALLLALAPTTPDPSPRVGVRLEDAQGLSPEQTRRLVHGLATSVHELTGMEAIVDDHEWQEECAKADRCAAEIRDRTRSRDVVFVKAYSAATRFRLIADRANPENAIEGSVQADLPRDEGAWGKSMRGVAEILFPMEASADKNLDPARAGAVVDAGSKTGTILAWSAIGAGAVAGGIALALRVQSNSLRSDVENGTVPMTAVQSDESTVRTNATISNVLFGLGAVLATAGIIHLLD